MRRAVRLAVLLVIAIGCGVAAAWLMPKPLPQFSRAEFLDEVHRGHITRIEIEDRQVIIGVSTARGAFRTDFRSPDDDALPDQLRSLGVEVRFVRSTPGLI